jgi:hypothetical protein
MDQEILPVNKLQITTTHAKAWNQAYSVALGVPISDEQGDIAVRLVKGNWYDSTIIHRDRSIAACGPLESERREVEEAADLVFELELVCPVPARRDRAVGACDAVLP